MHKSWAVRKLSEIFFLRNLAGKFCPKMQNLGLNTPVLAKFRGKIKVSRAPAVSSVGNLQSLSV